MRGSKTGKDWTHFSNRKKTRAESGREREAREELELLAVARSGRASGHGKDCGFCPKSTGKF